MGFSYFIQINVGTLFSQTTITGKSTSSEHILNAGHMRHLHFENDPKRINALEEMEIMKVTTSDHMVNIVQNNNPLYQILQPLQDKTTTSQEGY